MAKKQVENYQANLSTIMADVERGVVTQLAKKFGYHRVTMSNKLHGHDPISMEEAESIAEYFGYTLSDLLVPPREFRKILASA